MGTQKETDAWFAQEIRAAYESAAAAANVVVETLRGALNDARTTIGQRDATIEHLLHAQEAQITSVISLAKESTSLVIAKAQVEAEKHKSEAAEKRWDKALQLMEKPVELLTELGKRSAMGREYSTPKAKEAKAVLVEILQNAQLCDAIALAVGKERWVATVDWLGSLP